MDGEQDRVSRRGMVTAFRAAAGLALLWLVVERVDLGRLRAALASCEGWPVATGAAWLLAAAAVQVARFHALAGGLVAGAGDSARITLASLFFNQVSPGGLGGEVYRAVRLRRASDRWSAAMALILVERFLGGAALLVPASLYGLAVRSRLRELVESRWLAGHSPAAANREVAIALAMGAVALLAAALWRPGRRWLTRARSTLGSQLARIPSSRYRIVAILSLVYHLLRLLGFSAFARAVHQSLAWGEWLIVLAIALLASLIPLSLGALGLREGAIVAGLALFGVETADGLVVALLNRAVLVLLALVGGGVLLGSHPAAELSTPDGREP